MNRREAIRIIKLSMDGISGIAHTVFTGGKGLKAIKKHHPDSLTLQYSIKSGNTSHG